MGIVAADLIADGECTPACLLAHPSAPCTCRCGSRYHAALLDAEVSEAPGWWNAIPGGHREYPVLNNAAAFRAKWSGDLTGVFAYVRPQGAKWAVHEFGATIWQDGKRILQEGLYEGLVLARRCDGGSTGQDPSAYGFRTCREAHAAAHLLVAIDWMHTEEVLPCLRELDRALQPVPHLRLARTLRYAEEYERREELIGAMWDDPLIRPLSMAIAGMYRRALPARAEAAP